MENEKQTTEHQDLDLSNPEDLKLFLDNAQEVRAEALQYREDAERDEFKRLSAAGVKDEYIFETMYQKLGELQTQVINIEEQVIPQGREIEDGDVYKIQRLYNELIEMRNLVIDCYAVVESAPEEEENKVQIGYGSDDDEGETEEGRPAVESQPEPEERKVSLKFNEEGGVFKGKSEERPKHSPCWDTEEEDDEEDELPEESKEDEVKDEEPAPEEKEVTEAKADVPEYKAEPAAKVETAPDTIKDDEELDKEEVKEDDTDDEDEIPEESEEADEDYEEHEFHEEMWLTPEVTSKKMEIAAEEEEEAVAPIMIADNAKRKLFTELKRAKDSGESRTPQADLANDGSRESVGVVSSLEEKDPINQVVPDKVSAINHPDLVHEETSLQREYLNNEPYLSFIKSHYSSPAAFERMLDTVVTQIEANTIDSLERFFGDSYESPFAFIQDMTVDEVLDLNDLPNTREELKAKNIKYETFVTWVDLIDDMQGVVGYVPNMTFGEMFARWMIENEIAYINETKNNS